MAADEAMIKHAATLSRTAALGALLLVAVSLLEAAAPRPQSRASDLFKPQQQLDFFEVYHIPDGALYRSRVSLSALISTITVRDYARIRADNSFAVNALYSGLHDTIVDSNAGCDTDGLDVRWAIVLTYKDHAKEVLGFNRIAPCLQVSSREMPIFATAGMVEFVDRTFGFMR